ncbi:MAG: hypothetical protein AAGU11_00900 [Syntrophobacteraceae bacterium]
MAQRGRPTEYDREYHPAKALKYCATHGFTLDQLADVFDVNRDTIYEWKNTHPEFSDAIQKGKDEYDSDIAEACLKKRVTGFEAVERVYKADADGVLVLEEVKKKQIAPDVAACFIWLKNRRPGRWRDRQEIAFEHPDRSEYLENLRASAKGAWEGFNAS